MRYSPRVVRGMTALRAAFMALVLGFVLVTAVAYARRAPQGAPPEEPASLGAAFELPITWGPDVSLSSAERGFPFRGLSPVRILNVNTRRDRVD